VTGIFNEQDTTNLENTNENNTADQNPVDAIVNKLMDIKREDGSPKYESIDDALEALKHSQTFIPQLQQENADLRAKAQENETLKQTIERLTQGNNMNEEKPNAQTSTNGGLSEEAVARLVEQTLATREEKSNAEKNVGVVRASLIQKYGSEEKAREYHDNKAKELGLDPAKLAAIAATSPQAALTLLGEVSKTPTPINTSSVLLPHSQSTEELKAPEVSLLSGRGATAKNQIDFYKKVKDKVLRDLNVT
jgi:SpoU rRNA methylase family enzyme